MDNSTRKSLICAPRSASFSDRLAPGAIVRFYHTEASAGARGRLNTATLSSRSQSRYDGVLGAMNLSRTGLTLRRAYSSSLPRFHRTKVLKKHDREIIQARREWNQLHEAKAEEMGLGWRTVVSSILHRYPVIRPEAEPWESDMENLQDMINDKKRDHFLDQTLGTDSQMIEEKNPTFEEILESMPFKPASRITEADEKDDRRSMNRMLDKSCFLVVKRNREDKAWQFPQGKLSEEKDGKSPRSTAERVLDRAVGKVNRYFISNAPVGHVCYPYQEDMQKKRGEYGAKVFFYRAQLIQGTIKLETRLYTDYAWIGRKEVGEYFDEQTADLIHAILPE